MELRVIGRLTHVNVIIWMNWFFRSNDSAAKFNSSVGNDFVDVHVCLSSATSLPNDEREMVI